MSDINMTPLIDVMLVLLVIFMITAPLMASSLKLDLPKADAGEASDAPQSVSVALDPQGRYYFGDEIVDAATFGARLAAAAGKNPQTEVQLRADQTVPYGRVAELIAIVQKAGLTRIGFVTEPPAATAATPGQSPPPVDAAAAPDAAKPTAVAPNAATPTPTPTPTPTSTRAAPFAAAPAATKPPRSGSPPTANLAPARDLPAR